MMPDRPLDERLAQALGWRRPTAAERPAHLGHSYYDGHWMSPDGKMAPQVPAFSGCWEGAGLVVEAMCATPCRDGDHFRYRICGPLPLVRVAFHHPLADDPVEGGALAGMFQWSEAEGETLPLAICRAALAALEALGKGETQ